jgi:NAD(P)-dependent dehydrogenase (short-subunit alcohol dehydrogenase family)
MASTDSNDAGGVAVITGAGSGLGAAMARVFSAAGFTVVALDIDAVRARATADALIQAGGSALGLGVDVSDSAALTAAAQVVRDIYGECHILCANVGVQQFGAIDRLTENDWRWVLNVNVLGTINTVNCFLPLLRAAKGPRHIVLTSSSSVLVPAVRMSAYITTKHAVTGFGETLRLELAAENIGVAILFPGGMHTRHLESSKAARPTALGESVLREDDIQTMLSSSTSASSVVEPEFAIRNLLKDLQDQQPYIITHGEYRDELAAHYQALLDACDRMLSS